MTKPDTSNNVKVIDTVLLKVLRHEINEALKPVAQKYGIALAAGNASYTAKTFSYKLAGALPDDSGNVQDPRTIKAMEDYKRQAVLYGMKTEWLGRAFTYGGRNVKLIGLMPKRSKFPILVEDSEGKQRLFPYEAVKAILSGSV